MEHLLPSTTPNKFNKTVRARVPKKPLGHVVNFSFLKKFLTSIEAKPFGSKLQANHALHLNLKTIAFPLIVKITSGKMFKIVKLNF